MTPAHSKFEWNVAKIAIAIIGAILSIAIGLAARAVERQASAFDSLKEAVYNGQTKAAVADVKIDAIDMRVKRIEAKLFESQK